MERERADEASRELREAVASAMARITEGDTEAVWELHDLAEHALARILRSEARRIDFRISEDDVFDLTLDAAIDLAKLARAWRPEGALPWVWARRRITALVHEHVGTFARPLEERHMDVEEPPPVPRLDHPREVLRSLARRHPSARNLEQRLDATTTARDADIWLGVQLEKASGNRSPAVTIGTDHGMRPEAIRKVVQRVAQRLTDVA